MTTTHPDVLLLQALYSALARGLRPDLAALAEAAGVSTPRVRLALARLRARGLVQPSTLGLTFPGLAAAAILRPRAGRRVPRPRARPGALRLAA
ncbi:MAG: GntR family transcriptional regulator [Polyangiaceae bacterium]|nr:GntR family transcriptional regulator [Polyangiaceae bacterium]